MKKILFTFSLLVCLLLASCSGNSPKVVAEKFLKAINKADFKEAKKYCDKDSQELLSIMESFSKGEDAEKAKAKASDDDFTITKVEEDGDKAKVYYKAKDSEKEIALDLKKVDGKWLVSINKEQGNKEHGAPGEEGDDHTHPDDADMGDEPHEHEGEPAQDSIPAM